MAKGKKFFFQRIGRSYHLRISSAKDLSNIPGLDEAHWVAVSAPVDSFNCDLAFLKFLDADGDGRILASEVKKAVGWALETLKDPEDIVEARPVLRLNNIRTDQTIGTQIHDAAAKALALLNSPGAAGINLEQVRKVRAELLSMPLSESGVILPEISEDPDLSQFLSDVIQTTGGTDHPGGMKGATMAQVDDFLNRAKSHVEWLDQAEASDDSLKSDIMPLGAQTTAAFELMTSIRGKIDQYFAQCKAAAWDQRVIQHLNQSEALLESKDFKDPETIEGFLTEAALAKVTAERVLVLDGDINPIYAGKLAQSRSQVFEPILGHAANTLSEKDWLHVTEAFAAHESWLQSKPDQKVAELSTEKLKLYLDRVMGDVLRKLIQGTSESTISLEDIELVEKLTLYQINILAFVNNFVSFPDLYDPKKRALFEMGTIIMDGRHFNLSFRVDNHEKHLDMAKKSSICVLYVEIMASEDEKKYEVAVPVTSGSKGNLSLGKRGIFVDREGLQWDARIADIVDNPISIMEAIVSPFQKLAKLFTGKIESMTATAEKKLGKAAGPLQGSGAAPAPGPSGGLLAGGLLVGGSFAVAALGSAAAFITKTLAQVAAYKIALGLMGALLAVIMPTCLLAALKLRGRDLSAILEGSGWAVNGRMRLTLRLGRFFTQQPKRPS